MRVFVYVEGRSDELALNALWECWRQQLRTQGHGISIHPLDDKSKFFRKIGPRAAQRLVDNDDNLVVGLPDFYPNSVYESTPYKHENMEVLKQVQEREVSSALESIYGLRRDKARSALERFFASALKHDLEMLLLAAQEQLRDYLGTRERLGNWQNPVEEQNQDHPPKRVVENLFLTKSRKRQAYRDTFHAPAILRKVTNLKTIIYNNNNQVNCPVFKAMLEWIGERTGAPAYQ